MKKQQKSDEWVVVGRFTNDIAADMTVSMLTGSGIPAARYPVASIGASGYALVTDAVRVLVPPDHAANARELIADADINIDGMEPQSEETETE